LVACVVLIGVVYRLGRRAVGVLGVVACGDRALMAEVLVLRQESAVHVPLMTKNEPRITPAGFEFYAEAVVGRALGRLRAR